MPLEFADPAVLVVEGELDLSAVPSLSSAVTRLIERNRGAMAAVDLDAATLVDDSAIGVIVAGAHDARRQGGRLAIVASESALIDRLRKASLWEIHPTRAATLAPVATRDQLTLRRAAISTQHLHADRPASTARGVHHVALISADVERTVRFYQDLLGFPLTDMFENRDLAGSTHFFFDIGHGDTLAFFDLPGVDVGTYAEVFGGLHHLAISMQPNEWAAARARLDHGGIDYQHIDGSSSIYFRLPPTEASGTH